MSGLVSGYSGIIAPPNLATNGNFMINQRGFSDTTYSPVKSGDYVADTWYISSNTTVDYLEVKNDKHVNNHNGLRLKGYGKKGQIVSLFNRDTDRFGQHNEVSFDNPEVRHILTASVIISLTDVFGFNSVPVMGKVIPRYRTGTETKLYDNFSIIEKDHHKQIVSIYKTLNDDPSIENESQVIFELMEDGEFFVSLHAFGLFAGAFKNPPKYAPIPYADDLARCQRYYQKGSWCHYNWSTSHLIRLSRGRITSGGSSTNTAVKVIEHNMANTPALTISTNSQYIKDTISSGLPTVSNPITDDFHLRIVPSGDRISLGLEYKSSYDSDMLGVLADLSWTAEVV